MTGPKLFARFDHVREAQGVAATPSDSHPYEVAEPFGDAFVAGEVAIVNWEG